MAMDLRQRPCQFGLNQDTCRLKVAVHQRDGLCYEIISIEQRSASLLPENIARTPCSTALAR